MQRDDKIQFNKMRSHQQVNKNKLYLCETKIKTLIEEMIKFTENRLELG